MKIFDAKTMIEVKLDHLNRMLLNEYFSLWLSAYGGPPKGMHPIPSNVAQDDVNFFISFSEHQE